MVLIRRINFWILGVKGVNCFIYTLLHKISSWIWSSRNVEGYSVFPNVQLKVCTMYTVPHYHLNFPIYIIWRNFTQSEQDQWLTRTHLTFSRRDSASDLSDSFLILSRILFLAPLVTPWKKKELKNSSDCNSTDDYFGAKGNRNELQIWGIAALT